MGGRVTEPTLKPNLDLATIRLDDLRSYLVRAGWIYRDDDSRSAMWQAGINTKEDLRVVLPLREDIGDYEPRIRDALRVLAYAERRQVDDVVSDVRDGGADTIAVRLTPDAPSGEAPLGLAHSTVAALREYVVGSAAGLATDVLVLPPRRPPRAELYADQVRVSTSAGSFVVTLRLPLYDANDLPRHDGADAAEQPMLINVLPHPYGRRVAARMQLVASTAKELARDVGAGDRSLRDFGHPGPSAPNATELGALAALGGPERGLYRLRFAQSPLAGEVASPPLMVAFTPSDQAVLSDASEFLRTRQPRPAVSVAGLVVRLARTRPLGPGEVVIQGIDDDSHIQRRFRVDLTEGQYIDAVRAHQVGLQVIAEGALQARGTHLVLSPLTSFAVIPGLDEGD
jgi:hypothetical protein